MSPGVPESSTRRVLFVQPFSLGRSGGGTRILSSMIRGQPFAQLSIFSDSSPEPPLDWIEERHVPLRPGLGRLDRGRLSMIGQTVEVVTRTFFKKRLAREMAQWQPDVVHIVPHWSSDFHIAWRLARARGCRVVMSAHDDLEYLVPASHPLKRETLRWLGEIWRDADHVFCISQELGDEYGTRYGPRPFEIITDGLAEIPAGPLPAVTGRLNVYFMGLFHYGYRENLRVLTQVLAQLKRLHPATEINLTMRCGELAKGLDSAFPAQVLPFAGQDAVLQDMAAADLLYLPLHFGSHSEGFVRYSLSTKMVSYLGSGVPILYHGPREAAAARLLARHRAAFFCHSLEDSALTATMESAGDAAARSNCVEKALQLARTAFPLDALRRKFLKGLLS